MERSIYRALLMFGATVLVIWSFGLILWPFVVPIMWALCLAAVTTRLYRALARRTGQPRLSALAMVVTTAVTILAPLIIATALVIGQAKSLDIEPAIERLKEHVPSAVASIDKGLDYFGIDSLENLAKFQVPGDGESQEPGEGTQARVPASATHLLGSTPVKGALAILAAPFIFLFGLAITLITQYFLYLEAPRVRGAVIDLSPLALDDTDRILVTLRETTSASVLGGLLVAMIQGALGGVGFAIAGIQSPLVWAFLMMAFSLLPFGGTALVWLPAGVYLLVTGEAGAGWFILIWGTVIVGSSDNFLRPWILTKTGAGGIHPLLLFFAILSGIGIFGISGIVFGPLLLALLTAVVQIYREHWPRDPVTGELEHAPGDS